MCGPALTLMKAWVQKGEKKPDPCRRLTGGWAVNMGRAWLACFYPGLLCAAVDSPPGRRLKKERGFIRAHIFRGRGLRMVSCAQVEHASGGNMW